jgi:hypothetical protein
VTLFTHATAAVIPGIEDGGVAPIIAVQIVADAGATGACADVSGVTLSVTGHAEATTSYMGTGWPGDPKVASTTASVGPLAFLGGVQGGQGASKVTLAGTKTGCKVTFVSATQTGSFALVSGAITEATATLTN